MPLRRVLIATIVLLSSAISGNAVCFRTNTSGMPSESNSEYVFIDGESVTTCNCSSNACMRKCCADDEILVNRSCTYTENATRFKIFEGTEQVTDAEEPPRINAMGCLGNEERYMLTPEQIYLQGNGELLVVEEEFHRILRLQDYCLDIFEDGFVMGKVAAVVCFREEQPSAYIYVGMIISMPFLLITFLVYATLPDRNIHGKSLMCYVLSLLLAYVFLVAILMKSDYQPVPCQILAYVCYFFFLASFFWMNVMCIDIWWTFSGKRGIVGSKRKSQKRFILFSCYAWGVPIFFLALLAVLNHTLPENSDFHPKVGYMKCWISDGVPLLLYFYGTMALLIVFNVILFILTALKIRQAKKETAMLKKGDSKRHSYENEKQRFNLYLKLLLAMGLNWAMEVISWIFEWQVKDLPKTVWILTDTCNALYGVFIFFIFVFKRNIWNHLQRRYYVFTGRSVKANNLANSISNPTRTTSQSFQDKIPMGEVASSVGP